MKVLVTATSKHATAEMAAAVGEVLRDAHVDAAVISPEAVRCLNSGRGRHAHHLARFLSTPEQAE